MRTHTASPSTTHFRVTWLFQNPGKEQEGREALFKLSVGHQLQEGCDPFLNKFCGSYAVGVKGHLFPYMESLCWKDCLLLVEFCQYPFWKSVDHICAGLILDSHFFSLELYVCVWANTTLTCLLNLYRNSWARGSQSSNFVILPNCFGSSRSSFLYKLSSWLDDFYKEASWDFDEDYIEFMDQFGHSGYLSVECTSPWTWYISACI